MRLEAVTNILQENDRIAEENRAIFDEFGLYVLNLMSSPGAGKTSLLERTVSGLGDEIRIGVIEGDIATDADALRIQALGAPVVQINTGGGCHLDGNMIRKCLSELPLEEIDLLVIENVGNLVCPAEFNVGEDDKAMILSVTEGHDKPLKYPLMFTESSALLLNKTDLIPHTDFDLEIARNDSLMLNPQLEIIGVSCRTGEGLNDWFEWLKQRMSTKKMSL